jgi:threonine synthase
MRYISTRGQSTDGPARAVSFKEAVMAGLAPDGGLYLPEQVPDATSALEAWQSLPFRQVFQKVVHLYAGTELSAPDLADLTERAFVHFTHPDVTPVVRVGPLYVMELFHGPTFAFKDVALQFLGPVFEKLLAESGRHMTVVGATSGDTGSAAIHALRGRAGIEVFILFPKGRVSPVQEWQMTTVPDSNIHAIAVEGSFDDAQDIVKGMFNDRAFNEQYQLGAVNSINWARVMAQITYFFCGYFQVLQRQPGMKVGDPILVSVPTGNFGHMCAALLARRMGLPIQRLVLSTNANSILHRFVSTGEYRPSGVVPTHSPSMDIQVASNFERYLFDLVGRDASQVRTLMDSVKRDGGFTIGKDLLAQVQKELVSSAVDNEATLATIREVHAEHGYLLDPHSAVGMRAALDHLQPGIPTLTMATAHPAKFAEAIRAAIGQDPPIPPALAGLERFPKRIETLPAKLRSIQDYIARTLR